MTQIFQWKQRSKGLFRGSDIELYTQGVLMGSIPDESLKRAARINGKLFLMLEPASFRFPKCHRMIEPDTGQTWCDVEECEDGTIWAMMEGRRYDIGIREDDNPAQSNGLIMQGYNDKLFSSSNGRLEIRTDKHTETFIACFFFVRHLRRLQDTASM